MSPSRGAWIWSYVIELVVGRQPQAPWYFDCSNNPEWNAFRQRFAAFRQIFTSQDRNDETVVLALEEILQQANVLGARYEPTFVKYASDWSVFHLCHPEQVFQVPEDLQTDFCFYGFTTVQWLGMFGHQHYTDVPGMSEWAHNARGFLNDAAKFNAMHFLESSGWDVKMVDIAKSLSNAFMANSDYRVSRDAALPASLQGAVFRQSPEHTRLPGVKMLKAVGISYHTALIREPLTFWQHMLTHAFDIQITLHILDVTAKTAEDVARLHTHCRFIGGSWCATDERLLQLNELFMEVTLDCHAGDHKARHHFLRSAKEYYDRFVQLMGNDPVLREADFFMCGEPVLFCRLLSYFGQPVIGYISTPISVHVGKADRAEWYQQFHDMALDPRHIFATTTPIFNEWVVYATGIDLPVIRPICSYTEASYWPRKQRQLLLLRSVSLFWDTECVLNYFADQMVGGDQEPLRFRESTSLSEQERQGYSAFAEFRAAVIYPYSPSQFWFYELYSMAVPILMPTRESMPLYVSQDYSVCPDFEGHRVGHAPQRVHPHSPFDTDDWAAMSYWTAFTDYLTLPNILHFSSVPDLIRLAETSDLQSVSRKMKKVHMQHMGLAMTFWTEALDRVAALRGVLPRHATRSEVVEEVVAVESLRDELRDLSTRQPSGGSPARIDGPHRLGNDGDTRQDHLHQYHFDVLEAAKAAGTDDYVGASHWWVKLRRMASHPEVKIWTRECCSEIYGRRLFLLLGNSSNIQEAADCATLEVEDGQLLQVICPGTGEYLFVEARPGNDVQTAVLMLPEVRVLSRD